MARNGLTVTVGQLKGALKQLEGAFSDLKTPADSAAKPLEKVADSLERLQKVSSNFKKLGITSSDIEKAFPVISDDFKNRIQNFVESINEAIPTDSLNKFKNISKSLRTFTLSLQDFKDLKTIELPDNSSIRDSLVKFINSFNEIDVSHNKMDELTKSVRQYVSVIKSMDSYTPNPSVWNVIRDSFTDFITDFNTIASKVSYDKTDGLVKAIRRYVSVMKVLDNYNPNPSAWDIVRASFTDFINAFNTVSSSIAHDKIDELSKAVTKYITVMKSLDNYTPNPSAWNIVRDSFTDFITDFNTITKTINNDSTDKLVKSVRSYVNVMKALDGYTPNLSAWTVVRDGFTSFITGFIPTDPTIEAQFNNGISMVDKISSVLKKYVSVSKSIVSFGTVDWQTLGTGFKDFISIVASVVSDSRITGISDKAIQHFSKISNSLKGIASIINSISGKAFANLKANLSSAVTEIEIFINKMALLAKLPSFSDFERVANAVGNFKGKLQDTSKEIERTSSSMIKFRATLRQIYTALVGGSVIYSIIRGIKNAVKEIYDLEYAMARVNTIARVSNEQLKTMTHTVQDLSARFGVASSKVSKALYDINSATIKGQASMKILEQSLALAVAGFTDVEKVTDLIAKAVNAYEYNVKDAAKVSDILFVTVERGINPMEELSEYMGRMFTVAANAGVSLEEVGAGLATLTARGYQTNVASTALNSAILKLSTGTKELNKLFRQYGYASSASALRTMGLTGALQVLYKATGGATEKLHDLGFNYRDIRAATTLASSAINEYNKTLAMMNDETYTANKTAEAYAKVQDTVKFKFEQLRQTYISFIQTIGELLDKNQTLKEALSGLTEAIENLKSSMQGYTLGAGEQFKVDVVTLIPKLVALYGIVSLLSKAIVGIGTAFKTAGAAGKGFLASTASAGGIIAGMFGLATASNIYGNASKINEEGTWLEGLKLMFKGTREGEGFFGKSFGFLKDYALMGVAGGENLLNVLGFHPDWYQKLRPADIGSNGYTAPAFSFEESQLMNYIGNATASLRKLDLKELGYSEESILAEYDKLREGALEYANERNISKEVFEEYIKQLDNQKNELLKLNKEFLKLHPNIRAFRDAFEEASKNVKENIEKFADPLQKAALDFIKVEEAMNILTKETGLDASAIRSAFTSPEKLQELKEHLSETGKELSGDFNNALLTASELVPKTTKEIDKMIKSFVKLGLDMRQILPQISLDDIVSNAFNLSGVSAMKSELRDLLSSPTEVIDDNVLNSLIKATLQDIDAMKPLSEIQKHLMEINPKLTPEQASTIYSRVQSIIGFTSDFINQLSEVDFMKTMNKLTFGGELSAFKQYKQFDKQALENIFSRDVGGRSFREALQFAQTNGLDAARREFGEASYSLFVSSFNEYKGLSSSSSALMTETKNIKKKIHTFLKNYEDAFLTPMQRFEKTSSIMNRQLATIKKQLREGNVDPLLASRYLENIEKLQKLNEETMQMKVPSSITASEAVRTGSREAFDLVATNIFRDMYKVNVQQKNLQDKLVEQAKKLNQYLTNSDNALKVMYIP